MHSQKNHSLGKTERLLSRSLAGLFHSFQTARFPLTP